jgi:peroxin-3
VEQTLAELQRQKEEKLAKGSNISEVSTGDLASVPGSELDTKSLTSFMTDSYVHASQATESVNANGESKSKPPSLRTTRSKAVLWNEMKISCTYFGGVHTFCS